MVAGSIGAFARVVPARSRRRGVVRARRARSGHQLPFRGRRFSCAAQPVLLRAVLLSRRCRALCSSGLRDLVASALEGAAPESAAPISDPHRIPAVVGASRRAAHRSVARGPPAAGRDSSKVPRTLWIDARCAGAAMNAPGQLPRPDFPRFGLWPYANRFPSHPNDRALSIVLPGTDPIKLSDAFADLPRTSLKADFHCVTTWSHLGVDWGGVAFAEFFRRRVLPAAVEAGRHRWRHPARPGRLSNKHAARRPDGPRRADRRRAGRPCAHSSRTARHCDWSRRATMATSRSSTCVRSSSRQRPPSSSTARRPFSIIRAHVLRWRSVAAGSRDGCCAVCTAR